MASDERMEGVTEGRFVHYVLSEGEHRAAMIVRGWGKPGEAGIEHPNLYVFFDGTNDITNPSLGLGDAPIIIWRRHVPYDGETMRPGTWHWPERV